MSTNLPSMLACLLLFEDDPYSTVAYILANKYTNSAFLLEYNKDYVDYVLD